MSELLDAFDIAAEIISPSSDTWDPLPHQIPPMGNWFGWLLLGGRGAGKTATAARYMHDHVHGPPCLPDVPGGHWPSIIAPTLGDAVTSCVNGPSGLRAHCPDIKIRTTAGGTMVKWPNGCEAKLFGAHTPEDVERLRSGGNRCFVWLEELAAWRYLEESYQHMRYGLRIGPRPHWVGSTTPKPRMLIKKLVKDLRIAVTHATTKDNPHLDAEVKKALYEDYEGTRMGQQELLGLILEDVEGALWSYVDIEENRLTVMGQPDYYDRIVVGVDPAVTRGGDEVGIVVVGFLNPWSYLEAEPHLEHLSHGFILGDYSLRAAPKQWAREVMRAYRDHEANYIVAEVNQGGDLVVSNIHSINDALPVRTVHAVRGKQLRAEPIANLYQQGRMHHVGSYEKLEEQMTSWDPVDPDPAWSPDRLDAMVYAATEGIVRPNTKRRGKVRDNRLRGRR